MYSCCIIVINGVMKQQNIILLLFAYKAESYYSDWRQGTMAEEEITSELYVPAGTIFYGCPSADIN